MEMDKAKLHDEMLELEFSILERAEELTNTRRFLGVVNMETVLKRTKEILSDIESEIEIYQEYIDEKLS